MQERNAATATKRRQQVEAVLLGLARGEFHGSQVTLATGERVHRWPLRFLTICYERDDAELRVLRLRPTDMASIETDE